MAKPPPGPKGEQLGRLNYEFCRADIFGFLKALAEHYGDVVGFNLGGLPYIFVNGALQVHELFSQREACLRKPEFIKDSNRGHWGDGLTTLEGSAWQSRRRILGSCFRPGFVAQYLSIVAQCTEAMLDSWASGCEADLIEDLRILTARIAVRAVLDAELEGYGAASERSQTIPFVEAYGEGYVGARGGDPIAPLVVVRPRAPRRMDTTIRIIDERIASGEDRGDVLSHLIRAGLRDSGGLTREEIVGEVMQMLYAGHHTIPTSLVSFWRDIAESDMCARIAAEADHLCATGVPNSDSISDSYCLAALKESMRVHPAAPILYREVESDFELNGFEFPRDAGVWVSPQLLHSNPSNFPEPHRFIPERFLHGNPTVTARFPYFPFGAGRRACIANHLALHQMALIALLTARRFNFVLSQDERHNFRTRPQAWNARS
jgi:enediyne biosynthesis protein E7